MAPRSAVRAIHRASDCSDYLLSELKVNVPFDFVVNHTAFPAGEYIVNANTDGHRFIIQNLNDPEYVIQMASNDILLKPSETHDHSKMVFAKVNGKHVLHQICFEGNNHTHDLLHASDVIELASTQ